MTQNASPSNQTDAFASVRLDGLISILQGLRLEDRSAIAAALLADSGEHVSEEAIASDSAENSGPEISVPALHTAIVDSAVDPAVGHSPSSTFAPHAAIVDSAVDPAIGHSPSSTLVPAEVHAPSTVITVVTDDYDTSSDDEDAADAALADDSELKFYHGKYFNVPIEATAPLYYITRGRYIGVFSGWDATGPKVLGVSRAIFHKVETVDIGVGIVKRAIDRGDAVQVV